MLSSTVSDAAYLPLIVALVVAVIELVAGLSWGDLSADSSPRRIYTTAATGFVLSGSALVFLLTQNTLAQTAQALVDMKEGNHLTALVALGFAVCLVVHTLIVVAVPLTTIGALILAAWREYGHTVVKVVREYSRKFRLYFV